MVMKKSWKLAKKIMEFCGRSRTFSNFAPTFYLICVFLLRLRNLESVQEVNILRPFLNYNLSSGMVMIKIMKRSWTFFFFFFK